MTSRGMAAGCLVLVISPEQSQLVAAGALPAVSSAQKKWTYSLPHSFIPCLESTVFKQTVLHPIRTGCDPKGHLASHAGSHAREQ